MIDTEKAVQQLQEIITSEVVEPVDKLKAIELLASLNQQETWADQAREQQRQFELANGTCPDCPPYVGMTVLYNHPGDATGKFPRKQSPAMLLQVHEDGSCDLHVFTAPTWHGDVAVSGGGEYTNLRAVEGDQPFNWTRLKR